MDYTTIESTDMVRLKYLSYLTTVGGTDRSIFIYKQSRQETVTDDDFEVPKEF